MHTGVFIAGIILMILSLLIFFADIASGIAGGLGGLIGSLIVLPFIALIGIIGFIMFLAGLIINPKVTVVSDSRSQFYVQQEVPQRFCGHCGRAMKTDLKFCPSCGKPSALHGNLRM